MIHADITKQRGAAADLFMYTACQLPYNYVSSAWQHPELATLMRAQMHLMTTVVKLHLLLVATVSGTFIGQGINAHHWTDVAWGYLLLLVREPGHACRWCLPCSGNATL